MKALIFGAGRMGKAAGFDLEREGFEVVYADYQRQPGVTQAFATDDNVKLFSEFNVVLGCAGYHTNLDLTQQCIEAKTHFCDLGGNNDIVQRQLELDYDAKRVGITIIPDCGLAPGLAGLFAALAIDQLGGKADVVEMYVGGLPFKEPKNAVNYTCNWSIEGLINEYVMPVEKLVNGEIVTCEPFDDIRTVTFFDQIFEAFDTSGGISTLPRTLKDKCPNISYKTLRYPGHAQIFKGLKDLGFFNKGMREASTQVLSKALHSSEKDIVYVNVSAILIECRKSVSYSLRAIGDDQFSAMAKTTGFSIATIAKMLANGEVSSGVCPAEVCIPLEKYYNCMTKKRFEEISVTICN